jgi:predicted alpha-1,2-mannosidase
LFMKRASYYKNVWDSTTGFMRPRNSDGSFLEELNGREQEIVEKEGHHYYKYFDPLLVGVRPNRHYTESNAWQYIWSVQHDVKGLISLFGSSEEFNSKLDTFFNMDPAISGPKYIGVVGTIGQYVHGNQPSHHVAYLYDYSGQPWKTQQRVRQICDQLYRHGPGGLCGNEDMGSLSSWYVFSSMGFYPVTPGSTAYAIGSPLFGQVTINPGNGNTFIIRAENNSETNKYIQSATLNNQPLNKPWITHEDIMNGGILIFKMGTEPNKGWGNEMPPPSMSD